MRNEKGQFIKGNISWSKQNKGKYKLWPNGRSKEDIEKIRESMIGQKYTTERRKNISKALFGRKLSEQHKQNLSIKHKGINNWSKGEKSHFWKGGATKEYDIFKNGKEYKLWRKSVFERDNYTCKDCGFKNGNGEHRDLHPHHIKSASKFIKLRLDINNGITLCMKCHGKRHSINFKNRIYEYTKN